MSFPRYESYKETGMEWLGEVPESWQLAKLGFETWVRARLGWKGLKAEEYVEEGFALLSTPNIKGRTIDFEEVNFISQERYDESPEIKLSEGDVLLAKDGSTLGIANVIRSLPRPATVNSSIAVVTPLKNLDSVFLYYLLCGTGMQQLIQQKKGGMGVPHLFQSDIVKFPIPFPGAIEQRAIASFLDRETAKIDALIAEQQRLIELLQEKRQAVISHAVTKGLNPNAPMKDSGVEWLGEVPEHWECLPLKRYVNNSNAGEVIDKSFWGGSDELLYTCAIEPLWCDYLGFPEWKRTTEADLLLTRNGTPYVHRPVPGSIYTNVVQRITLLPGKDREYLSAALQNSANNLKGYGVSIESLNYQMWSTLPVPLPPLEEQASIIKAIKVETSKFDSLLVEVKSGIQLLQERRSALISAAVTGQIDVRGLVMEAIEQ